MIKFEIKDRKTGKTESYTKEDVTMGGQKMLSSMN